MTKLYQTTAWKKARKSFIEGKSYFMKEARKGKRKLTKWERHLLKADRNLWQKVRDAEKVAMGAS